MEKHQEITAEQMFAWFKLESPGKPLDIVPTATGGLGINNIKEQPPLEARLPKWRCSGREYVKKYLDAEKESTQQKTLVTVMPNVSTMSINTIDDVDETTAAGDVPDVNDLDNEVTEQIYSTYFNVPNKKYDEKLVITKYREEILKKLNISPVVIIQGPTGCGKTTQVPQYILDYHQAQGTYCNIIVTQPRKIAAISIARRVCHERGWTLGTIVGYQVAMEPKVSSDTRLAYVTTGVLLEKLVNAKRMDMYTHIIIDEVHERDQDIDFALLLCKKFLKTNSQRVKVILMSATFESDKFAQYFSLTNRGDSAPIVDVIGKHKEVTEHYLYELKTLLPKMPEFDENRPHIDPCLYDCVLKLLLVFDKIERDEQNVSSDQKFAPSRGAVLIFLPGYDEICNLKKRVEDYSMERNFWIIPLHSSITVEEQAKVFRDSPLGFRKIIISTNIAESSITVPDIKYVIDFCLTKCLETDLATNYTCLMLKWAAKSNCIQRKGRTGRVEIGRVYRMVPRQFYDRLADYPTPELQSCPLTKTILQLKKLDLCEPQEMFAFALDPPNLSDIGTAILHLKEGLALTHKENNAFDGDLTFVGRVMANLPLDIKLSKLILFGYVFRCMEECIIIAASLSLQSFFVKPFQQLLQAYRSRLAWADEKFSDCLAYLHAYQAWRTRKNQGHFQRPGGQREHEWAASNFIDIKRINEVDMLVRELKSRLEKLQICVERRQRLPRREESETNILTLKMVIAGAFFPHYYMQYGLGEQEITRELNELDPRSTVKVSNLPPKVGIVYASALRDIFSVCTSADRTRNMDIEFEGTKAYISFQRGAKMPTNTVLPEVYIALKMGKLRLPMELTLFDAVEAESFYNQLMDKSKNKVTSSEHQLSTNRILVKHAEELYVTKAVLPALSEIEMKKIMVSHVNDCGHFWARHTVEGINRRLAVIESIINKNLGANLKPLQKEVKINGLYLAPYSENQSMTNAMYYRAQVKEIIKNEAEVYFIDYGNTERIPVHHLRQIDETMVDVLNTQALAFECMLSEVKPSSIKTSSGKWCLEAIMWFKKEVDGDPFLYAKIYSVVNDVIRVELLKRKPDGTIENINKALIEKGFAEPADESLASKQNHELKLQAHEARETQNAHVSRSLRYAESTKDLEVSWQEAAGQSSLHKTHRVVRLQGPTNPLEVAYSGLTQLDRSTRVKVERDSVNSISLNAEPQETYHAMLVASQVGISPNTSDLILRNTTLMPKLRGLPSLICLLFSPYVEFRTDKERKSYTGALCGLGYNAEDREAIYGDHDIEVEFDVAFNFRDIVDINSVRMGFNWLLHSETDILRYPANSENIHDKIVKKMDSLLKRQREPKDIEYFHKPFRWDQVDPSILLEPDEDSTGDQTLIFPLHRPPALVTSINRKKELVDNINALKKMAENPTNNFRIIRCRVCSQDVSSTHDLSKHLETEKHRLKETEAMLAM